MARIFYFSDTGNVRSVMGGPHEGNPDVTLPAGVAWIDVPEAAHEIAWPVLPDGAPGAEAFCKIDPVSETIVLKAEVDFPPPLPLNAEDVFDILVAKGLATDSDRPPGRGRPVR